MLISEILNGIEYKSIINDIDIKKVTSRLNLIEENTLFVLKEVGICIGLVIIAIGLNVFLFQKYLTTDVVVESAKTDLYSAIDQKRYVLINADIQEEQNPTQKYETENKQLDDYQTEYRYVPGTINPFVSTDSVNDLPTEIVGVSGDITEDKK